jgi:hypothetical protein
MEGGCQCGAVPYRLKASPRTTGFRSIVTGGIKRREYRIDQNVCFWHKADIEDAPVDVRFRG